jgi:hypothetical protein
VPNVDPRVMFRILISCWLSWYATARLYVELNEVQFVCDMIFPSRSLRYCTLSVSVSVPLMGACTFQIGTTAWTAVLVGAEHLKEGAKNVRL